MNNDLVNSILRFLGILLIKYTPPHIQLHVKYNNRFIPYDKWLEIKQ